MQFQCLFTRFLQVSKSCGVMVNLSSGTIIGVPCRLKLDGFPTMKTHMISRRRLLGRLCAGPVAAAFWQGPKTGIAEERPSFNAAIDTAWQAGLAVLKPSARDLEH